MQAGGAAWLAREKRPHRREERSRGEETQHHGGVLGFLWGKLGVGEAGGRAGPGRRPVQRLWSLPSASSLLHGD